MRGSSCTTRRASSNSGMDGRRTLRASQLAELSGFLWNVRIGDELPVAGRAADDGVVREGRGRRSSIPQYSRASR